MTTGARILDTGRTPAEWVAVFAERGMHLSERSLRERPGGWALAIRSERGSC